MVMLLMQNENAEILSKRIQLDGSVQPGIMPASKQPVCYRERRKW